MNYFTPLFGGAYEALHLFSDRKTGLRALIAIHIDALLRRAKETHNRPEVVADHMVEEILEA